MAAIVDDCDFLVLSKYKWSISTGGSGNFYAHRRLSNAEGGKLIKMHKAIMCTPNGMCVDHINGNTLDNRRCNLRVVSHADNMKNKQPYKNGTSKYKGVGYFKTMRTYRARIRVDGRLTHVAYGTEIDCAIAYNIAAKKHFGEFARLNVITQ